MLLLYNVGIYAYFIVINIASTFNAKAKRWLNGRKQQKVLSVPHSIWFHFASLGEFEQGRPVLEAVRHQYPAQKIVITFFSPSGYEIRKDTPLADAVYYLPLDTAHNAREFIQAIQPQAAVFTKYEYWYHYFNELHKNNIPLYVISAIFRPDQVFFKWYGSLHRQILSKITQLFVQDETSQNLLHTIGITQVTISGDTRFDRVWANAQNPKPLPVIADFKNKQPTFIAGSTWPKDEVLVASLVDLYPDWKFIIAPHEISEDKINHLISLLPQERTVRFSHLPSLTTPVSLAQILVIDNIGMLSSLYQYGQIAYIGGGFGTGIHNTLEAAAFGLPVIFGPNYQKFKEAKDLIAQQAGFSIQSQDELTQITNRLMDKEPLRQFAGHAAREYVNQNQGATKIITEDLKLKA